MPCHASPKLGYAVHVAHMLGLGHAIWQLGKA